MKLLRVFNSNSLKLIRTFATSSLRSSSESNKIVLVEIDEKTNYAKLILNKPPVNSITPDFFNGIAEGVEAAEKNKSRGIIITSSLERNFCAGLDMKNLLNASDEYLKTLWYSAQECFFKLYGTSIPTTASINGSCPAGGCFISTCVEYRVIVDGFKIGLNESKLGISVPKMLIGLMLQLMPYHEVEKALMTGKLLNTNEAFKFGLIDEVATDKNDAIKKCEKYLENFNKMNLKFRGITKSHLRLDFMKSIEKIREEEIDGFVKSILDPSTQKTIENYLNSLQNK